MILSLACNCLSAYIWSMTLYDVYAPLSSNIKTTAEQITPATVVATAQRALWASIRAMSGQSSDSSEKGSASNARKPGRRRKHLTLAEAQREELRAALKLLIVWLVCKGVEPAFDNTAGYIVPFYNGFKAIVLLVFARFRGEISAHLFDAFVVPMGKPQAPLLDSDALAALVFPAMRFLVSLPLSQLSTLLYGIMQPIASTIGAGRVNAAAVYANVASARQGKPADKPDKLDRAKIVPPPSNTARGKRDEGRIRATSSSTASTRRRDDGGNGLGGGESGGGGGGGSAASARLNDAPRSRASLSNLALPSRFMAQPTARAVSHSDRHYLDSRTFSQLQALPPPPQDLPAGPQLADYGMATSSSAHHLPMDVVPPPPPRTSSPRSYMASSPRMPGTLGRSSNFSHECTTVAKDYAKAADVLHFDITASEATPPAEPAPVRAGQVSPASKRRHDAVSTAASLRSVDETAIEFAEPETKTRKTSGSTTRARSKTPATRRAKAAADTTSVAANTSSSLSRSKARTPATRTTRSRGATPQT